MANKLQKLIYNLSAASPLCFTFAILWYIQKQTLIVPAICVCLGSFFMLCFARSFSYAKKHVAPIMIRVTDISPKDGQMAAYVISYMLPFASMAIDDFDITVCGIIAAALIAIILFANSVTSNPLLFLRKYLLLFWQIIARSTRESITVNNEKGCAAKPSVLRHILLFGNRHRWHR